MEGRECHHKFLYKEMRQEYKTNSIKHWTWPPCQKDCVWNNGRVNRTEEVRWKERRQPDVPDNSASLQRKVEQPKETRPRRTALRVFRGSSKVKSHHHLFIYWSGLSPPLVLFLLMYCVQNKSQQNGLCSVCLVLTLPCICSNFMCRRGERGARQLSASNTQDTLNHTETRDTESTNSPIPHRLCMLLSYVFVHVLQILAPQRKSVRS